MYIPPPPPPPVKRVLLLPSIPLLVDFSFPYNLHRFQFRNAKYLEYEPATREFDTLAETDRYSNVENQYFYYCEWKKIGQKLEFNGIAYIPSSKMLDTREG